MNRRKFLQHTSRSTITGSLLLALNSARREFLVDVQEAPLQTESGIDFERLRQEFSLDPEITYLNHASIGAIPLAVQKSRVRYLELCEANPWLYMWGGGWDEPRESTRKKCAQLLHCDPQELVFSHNTTELFNTLANGLPMRPDDEVLFSTMNHAGASIAFEYAAARRGYKVRRFEFPIEQAAELTSDRVAEIYRKQISPATRLLVFPHIDNKIGIRYPVKQMVEIARDQGVEFIAVDGAQSAGAIEVDVRQMGVDVYSTSGHKWLGAPKGTGLGVVTHQMQTQLDPKWVTWGQKAWQGTARIYEDYGTRNLAEVLTIGDAVDFHSKVDFEHRENRVREIREHIQNRVSATKTLKFRSPQMHKHGSAVVSIELESAQANQVAKRLFDKHEIVVRPFQTAKQNAIRVSPNVYSTFKEIDKLLDILITL